MRIKTTLRKLVLISVLNLIFNFNIFPYVYHSHCADKNCINLTLLNQYLINKSDIELDKVLQIAADFFQINIVEKKINGQDVYIKIEKKSTINKIVIQGNNTYKSSYLLEKLNIDLEKDYFENIRTKLEKDLILFYSNNGFIDTVVTFDLKKNRNKNTLFIKIKEGVKLTIRNIHINILGSISKKTIFNILDLKKGEIASKENYNKNIRELSKYLFDHNYFSKRISKAEFIIDDKKVDINVDIETGPIINFLIEGDNILDGKETLFNVLDINDSNIIVLGYYDNLKNKLLKYYKDNGYINATIDVYDYVTFGRNSLNIIFNVKAGSKFYISSLNINSGQISLNKSIESYLKTNYPEFFKYLNKEKMEGIDAVVKSYLEDLGYLNVKTYPLVYEKNSKNTFKISLKIEEGFQAKIRKINFYGSTLLTKEDLEKKIDIRENEIFSLSKIKLVLRKLTDFYINRGFANFKIIEDNLINISKDLRFVDIDLKIIEGEKYYFGDIYVLGNTVSKDKVILRELDFKKGEIFNATKLNLAEKRLVSLGLFRDLNIVILDKEANVKDVLIKVAEKNRGVYEIGFGYKTDIGINVSSSITYNNINGSNNRVSLDALINSKLSEATYHFLEYTIGLSYFIPYFLDFPFDVRIASQIKKEDLIYYGEKRTNLSLYFEKTFGKNKIVLRNSIDNINTIMFDDVTEIQADTNYWKYTFRQSYFLDDRNSIFNPSSGYYLNIFAEYGKAFSVDTSNTYIKLVDRFRNYIELDKGFILYSTVNFGALFGLYGDELLLDERFFMGGTDSLRGYKRNFINDYIRNIDKQYFYTGSVELRKDLFMNLIGVGFFDFGDLNSNISDFNTPLLTAGLGIRLNFEVAYLSFEYGRLLNKDMRFDTKDNGRFHLSIGAY